jgi:hypothetical protein
VIERARLRLALNAREYLRLLRKAGVALAAFVLAFAFTQWWDLTVPSFGRAQYQAVFLTNGQTYFGRYYDRIGAYAKIEDVYYLQQVASSDPNATPGTRVVRRGRELHEPASRMLIPKSAILFIEDLTDASPIAQFMQHESNR